MPDGFGGQIVNVFELPRPRQKDPFEVARFEDRRKRALKKALRGLKGDLNLARHQAALVTILEAMLGLEITKEKRMKDEKTSKRVASIAGKVMRMRQLRPQFSKSNRLFNAADPERNKEIRLTWGEVLAMAGSCANQAEDKKPAALKPRPMICGNCKKRFDASRPHDCKKPATRARKR